LELLVHSIGGQNKIVAISGYRDYFERKKFYQDFEEYHELELELRYAK
jgi:hypothetical protein